jgi:hypothetical protein
MDFRIHGTSGPNRIPHWNQITPAQYQQFRNLRDAVPQPFSDIKFTSDDAFGHVRHLNPGRYEFQNTVRLPSFGGAMLTGDPSGDWLSFRARADEYAQLQGSVELNGGNWQVSQAPWLQRHIFWNNVIQPLHQQYLKFKGKLGC